MNDSAAKLPRMCHWFGHKWQPTKWSRSNYYAGDRHERHTHRGVKSCWRCGTEQKVEWFDDRAYWNSVRRDIEDERLRRVIREATNGL